MNGEYEGNYNEVLAVPVGDLIALGTAWLRVNGLLYESVGGDIQALAPEVRSYIEAIEALAEDIAGDL